MAELALARPDKATRVDPRDRQQLVESPVPWRRVARLFAPHRTQLLVVTLIIVASSVIGLAQPFLVKEVIDNALPNQDQRLLVIVTIAMVGVAAVTGALGVAQTWIATLIGQRVMHGLRIDVFDRVQAQSMDFFKRTRSGEIQSRMTNDISGMRSVITNSATSIASNVTTTVATAVAMIVLDWRLSLLTAVVLPPAIVSTRRVAMVRKALTRQRQRRLAELQNQVEEALSIHGVQLTKTLGISDRKLADYAESSQHLIDLDLRTELAGRWRMMAMQIVFAAIPAAVYLAAGFPSRFPSITLGTVVAFTGLQMTIFKPILGLLNIGAQWVASMALLSRIFGYLDLTPGVLPPTSPMAIDPGSVRGEVTFENITFQFPDGDEPVLRGITLRIPAGGSLGVAGETGSGKSTLASLLIRLADPTEGRVSIDGVDLRQIAPNVLTRIVGIVSQETYLMHDTVRANLQVAREGATDSELWEALEAAQIAEAIRALPEQLDTIVGSRGQRFSGGERQRLSIARTLLRNPPVLILDEATSALDNDTERELQDALARLTQGRTTLTIAHRLTTLATADAVVVLDAGRVVEEGDHESLLALGGRYAALAAAAERLSGPEADDEPEYLGRHSVAGISGRGARGGEADDIRTGAPPLSRD